MISRSVINRTILQNGVFHLEKYTCKICNRTFQTINRQVKQAHAISLDEYFTVFPGEYTVYTQYRERVIYPLLQERSPNNIKFYLAKGLSNEEAEKELLKLEQHFGSREEAKAKVKEVIDSCSLSTIQRRHSCSFKEAIEFQHEIIDRRFSTCLSNGISFSLEQRIAAEMYYFNVWRETNISWRLYQPTINPLNLKRGKLYHLDHKFSIMRGFQENVDPVYYRISCKLRAYSKH